jgi:hypothetical protein
MDEKGTPPRRSVRIAEAVQIPPAAADVGPDVSNTNTQTKKKKKTKRDQQME